MIKLIEFRKEDFNEYIKLYNEFIENKSDLIPDILELRCDTIDEYENLLIELENRKNGNHLDIDWYKDSYYFLAYDDKKLVGIGCIRNNLTKKGYDIWGNIAYGVRPSERKKGYGVKIAEQLVEKCRNLGIKEIILCHYEDNIISPKIFKKIGAKYVNSIDSTVSSKKIKRYNIIIK